MTNNSDGLTPTLRPQLGVGWNRALPAAFGFDNGLFCESGSLRGTLRNFSINKTTNLTLEFWVREASDLARDYFSINFNNGERVYLCRFSSAQVRFISSLTGRQNSKLYIPISDKNHVVFHITNSDCTFFLNGINMGLMGGEVAPENFVDGVSIVDFRISGNNYDEFRLYKGLQPLSNIILNYNSGIGENPCQTENLILWYKFQEFENLDFSPLQDNSDIKLGVRDLSGNNNHSIPVGMDTDPLSPNYVLKPF